MHNQLSMEDIIKFSGLNSQLKATLIKMELDREQEIMDEFTTELDSCDINDLHIINL